MSDTTAPSPALEDPFLATSPTSTYPSTYHSTASSPTSTTRSTSSKLSTIRSLFTHHQPSTPPLTPGPKTSLFSRFNFRRLKTPHTVDEPPWAPANLETRIDDTLVASWKSSWWRLYADTVRLRRYDNNSSRAVYLAVNCWATAAGINDTAERIALFRCYHDDAAVERLGYTRYGESMWRLCEEAEEKARGEREGMRDGDAGSQNGITTSRTW